MSNVEMKNTIKGNSYWEDNGAYTSEYDELYSKLVPSCGEAETEHGELIRCVSRLSYDYYNNGNCNARDIDYSSNDYDYDDEDYDVHVSDFYITMIEYINDTIGTKEITEVCKSIVNIILDECAGFDDETQGVYNKLTDIVMFTVINSENQPNEDYNKQD